jgi:hypothetical protein
MKKELALIIVLFTVFALLSPSFCVYARAESSFSTPSGVSVTPFNYGDSAPLANGSSSLNFTAVQICSGGANATSNDSVTITVSSDPAIGDVLILTLGSIGTSSSDTIASISQTGVTWNKAVSKSTSHGSSYYDNEIWYGNVVSGASTTIKLIFYALPTHYCPDTAEYPGLVLDKTNTTSGTGTSTETGNIVSTGYAHELWVGSTLASTYNQTNPRNGFTMSDGTVRNGISEALLLKLANTTGPADSGTTISASEPWSGCIATFYAGTWALGAYANPAQITNGTQVTGVLSYGSWGFWHNSSIDFYLGDDVLTMYDGATIWQIVEQQFGNSYSVVVEWPYSKVIPPPTNGYPTTPESNIKLGYPYQIAIQYSSVNRRW